MTDPRTLAALKILEENAGGAVAVSKPVRAGLTTSTVIAAEIMNKPILVVAPTLSILRDTVNEAASGGAVMVAGNAACHLLEEELKEYPILREIPIALPENCEECSSLGACEVTAILGRPNFHAAGISYPKIRAVMLSESEIAKKIRTAIQKAGIVLLDEAHLLGFGSAPTVPAGALPAVPEEYKYIRKMREIWDGLLPNHESKIFELDMDAQEAPAAKHLARDIRVEEYYDWMDLRAVWGELRSLAKSGTMEPGDILLLRDAIEILSQPWAVIHWVSDDGGRGGRVHVSGSRARGDLAISKFLHNVVPFATHVFASGTLIEPHENYFKELSGKPVMKAIFPDVMGASRRLTLIPDKWNINAKGFAKKLPAIVDQIRQISEREREPIYCLSQSKAKAVILRKEVRKAGIRHLTVDHFRSDKSIGVGRPERICICVGMAEIPANAYDPLARGRIGDERWIDSRRLRLHAVHAATWQGLNRVRDPEGKTPSKVYMIGVKLDAIRHLALWGPGRTAELVEIRDTRLPDGTPSRKPIFSIKVDEEVEHCNILSADINRNHSHNRRLTEYVESVELYSEPQINSQNHSLFPILYSREKGVILGMYNAPIIESEIHITATTLYRVFCHRTEVYAEQFKDSKGKWGFRKVLDDIRHETLLDHVSGKSTIGSYEIGLDDDVTWGCFDVDSHKAGDDGTVAKDKVRALLGVLEVYGIPYMLEASGSPGSYHIWVLFKRTRTYNAYRFMRQVASEAKVQNIEIWPKQKKLDKNGKYGNLVKLPICLHKKTGARSVFINAETFEPLEGLILVPGRVELLDLPDLTGDDKAMPKAKRVASEASGSNLDHCMIRTLAEGIPLEGSEGHELRLAIATKAANIGIPPEEAALLFKDQQDFDYEYSLKKCREPAKYGYSPWSCETLRAKCGNLVTRWCPTCPFAAPAFQGMSSG